MTGKEYLKAWGVFFGSCLIGLIIYYALLKFAGMSGVFACAITIGFIVFVSVKFGGFVIGGADIDLTD